MNRKIKGPTLQSYPRVENSLLAEPNLFPKSEVIEEASLSMMIDEAFYRCKKDKRGNLKQIHFSPEELVETCLIHLRERSDPILSPSFVNQCTPEELFELDAVSHEMQRHRMSMGIFYQYLILILMRRRWIVFDGYKEGDIIADVDTPAFNPGIRIYMSVKKSLDTVGGQDISGVIRRLEDLAKEEKNLTRPYLCVIAVATPSKGKLRGYTNDRFIKCNKANQPYSLNCEYWGPGFIFPFITGKSAFEIYKMAAQRVAEHLPFMTLRFKTEGARLLRKKLADLDLLNDMDKIDPLKFLSFIVEQKNA